MLLLKPVKLLAPLVMLQPGKVLNKRVQQKVFSSNTVARLSHLKAPSILLVHANNCVPLFPAIN
jgi:hypothetical protein